MSRLKTSATKVCHSSASPLNPSIHPSCTACSAAEQKCLCSPDTAYQVVQCFYKNYRAMTDQAMKANYYEDFLTYTYDCYCGVEPVDVTYNRTATPVVPYIVSVL